MNLFSPCYKILFLLQCICFTNFTTGTVTNLHETFVHSPINLQDFDTGHSTCEFFCVTCVIGFVPSDVALAMIDHILNPTNLRKEGKF